MKKLRNIIVFILYVLLILSISEVKAINNLTDARAAYPNGSKFNETYFDMRYKTEGNVGKYYGINARECAGFANYVFRSYYGFTAPLYIEKSYDVENIKPGDIVRYSNDGHSVFILSRNGEFVTVAEANYDWNNTVRWDQPKTMSELRSGFTYVYHAPYQLGQSKTCLIPGTKNVKVTLENTPDGINNRLYITYNTVDNVEGYRISIKNSQGKEVYKHDVKDDRGSYTITSFNYEGTFTVSVKPIRNDLIACTDATTTFTIKPITSITLNGPTTISMGDEFVLQPTVLPADTTYSQTLTYTSSNSAVATVTSSGKVKGISDGTTVITATSVNGVSTSYILKVLYKIRVISISLNKYGVSLYPGETDKLTESYNPTSSTIASKEWTSSDPYVARVDQNGNITAVSPGKATITITADGVSKSATVTVKEKMIMDFDSYQFNELNEYKDVTFDNFNDMDITGLNYRVSHSIRASSVNLTPPRYRFTSERGGFTELTIVNKAQNTSNKIIFYVSVPIDVNGTKMYAGDLDNDGKLTLNDLNYYDSFKAKVQNADYNGDGIISDEELKIKEAYLIMIDTNGNGSIDSDDKESLRNIIENKVFQINPYVELTYARINKSETTIALNGKEQLIADVTPGVPYRWKSDDLLTATVDENGVVTTHRFGTVNIYLVVRGEQIKCKVTVPDTGIKKITLDPKTYYAYTPSGSFQINAEVSPADHTGDGTLTYESTNEQVATVTSTGYVEIHDFGTATINVWAANGVVACCTVSVMKITVNSISIPTSDIVVVNETNKLYLTYYPVNSNVDREVKWTSSDPNIATVDQNGNVTGKKAGQVTITATAKNGTIKSECSIKVVNGPITDVKINRGTVKIKPNKTYQLSATITPAETSSSTALTWTSYNPSVATIDSTGKVTANKIGTTLIQVKTSNGLTDTVVVVVTNDDDHLKGDFNDTGKVDLTDILTMLKIHFKTITPDSTQKEIGDMNSDGRIDLTDVLLLLKEYFKNN